MSQTQRSSTTNTALLMGFIVLLAAVFWQPAVEADTTTPVPAAVTTLRATDHSPQTAVLAGGCFWGMELVFSHVNGVLKVVTGYAGGQADMASYWKVATGKTGHAESVRITFDPAVVSYTDLLRIYFSVAHDPTEINRQGPDAGTQYRSEIFADNAGQAKLAHAYITQLDKAHVFDAPIATRVARLHGFYPAEAYHQNYAMLHPESLYIQFNDMPKLRALEHEFGGMYKAQPSP
jgi:peptide-methionine (S)-S-oxide reductase